MVTWHVGTDALRIYVGGVCVGVIPARYYLQLAAAMLAALDRRR
jgi:hypothetical protein